MLIKTVKGLDVILQFRMWLSSVIDLNELTHGGRDKVAAIFLTTVSNKFSWMKICSEVSDKQYCSIGSDNGLAPYKPQTVIWANGG